MTFCRQKCENYCIVEMISFIKLIEWIHFFSLSNNSNNLIRMAKKKKKTGFIIEFNHLLVTNFQKIQKKKNDENIKIRKFSLSKIAVKINYLKINFLRDFIHEVLFKKNLKHYTEFCTICFICKSSYMHNLFIDPIA